MHIASTGVAPPAFGASVGVFLPKGSAAGDSERSGRRDRQASGTRPLELCNTDRKAVAGVINGPLRHQLRKHARILQCGFIQGRTATVQIIALETAARCEAARAMVRAMEDGWQPQGHERHERPSAHFRWQGSADGERLSHKKVHNLMLQPSETALEEPTSTVGRSSGTSAKVNKELQMKHS